MSCPLCGEAGAAPILEAACPDEPKGPLYRYVRCDGCGLTRIDPIPAPASLARFYSLGYHGGWSAGGRPSALVRLSGALNAVFLASKTRRILELAAKGSVLDFGCGNAELLGELRERGWEVFGVELSESGRRQAPAGIVVQPDLAPYEREGRRFDVVMMWHVLEHVTDPVDTLKRLRGLMKEGGTLFVAVPNFGAWEAGLGGAWFHLDPPRHLYQFTAQTLAAALLKAGFEPKTFDFGSWIYNVFGLTQTLLNLATPVPNVLYRAIKRADQKDRSRLGLAITALALAPATAIAVAVSAAGAAFARSGTVEATARAGGPAAAG